LLKLNGCFQEWLTHSGASSFLAHFIAFYTFLRIATSSRIYLFLPHLNGAAMSQEWYYSIDSTQQGPVSAGELRKLALNGTLKPTDMVWKDGMAEWTVASAIKGLFAPPTKATPKAEEPAPVPKPASAEPPLPDLPPVPTESAKPKPKKTGNLRDRLDSVQDKGRKKDADDEIIEIDDDDIVEEETPKRSRSRREEDEENLPQRRRRSDEDEDDRPRQQRKSSRSARGPSEMPSGIRSTGIIWMAIGTINMLIVLGMIGYVLIQGREEGPLPQEAIMVLICCGGCMSVIPALFLFIGYTTYNGTTSPVVLLLMAILSILFGLVSVGGGVMYFTNGGAIAQAIGSYAGISNLLFGIGFIAAGILAFMNKEEYETWKGGSKPKRSRRETSRYYDEDEDFDDEDDGPRRRNRR
jgi:hypothetical protein